MQSILGLHICSRFLKADDRLEHVPLMVDQTDAHQSRGTAAAYETRLWEWLVYLNDKACACLVGPGPLLHDQRPTAAIQPCNTSHRRSALPLYVRHCDVGLGPVSSHLGVAKITDFDERPDGAI